MEYASLFSLDHSIYTLDKAYEKAPGAWKARSICLFLWREQMKGKLL